MESVCQWIIRVRVMFHGDDSGVVVCYRGLLGFAQRFVVGLCGQCVPLTASRDVRFCTEFVIRLHEKHVNGSVGCVRVCTKIRCWARR